MKYKTQNCELKMGEFILKIDDAKKSAMLVRYLKSLDYVTIKAKKTADLKRNTVAKKDLVNFLYSLPEVDYTQNEVNEAISEIKK